MAHAHQAEEVTNGSAFVSPMNWKRGVLLFAVVLMLSGCATMPTGPMVPVLPGPGKPFEVFMADDAVCRQWAQQQIGGASPSQTANQNLATGATVGTLVGAAMGAAIGAATGNVAAGAAIGGGAGLLGGTAMGSNAGAFVGVAAPEALRHRLSAMHVCEGEPDPGCRAPPGASLCAAPTSPATAKGGSSGAAGARGRSPGHLLRSQQE